METDDLTTSYMPQAWAKLCKCLGHDFLPYMSAVMPLLLQSAPLKTDVIITSADSDNEIDESNDESMDTITLGNKRTGIKTNVLEEKATTCNMLCCYVDELKKGFRSWIDQVAPTLVPLLKFYFQEKVRKATVPAMPELLRSAKLAVEKGLAQGRNESYIKQMTDYIIPTLVEALHKEPDTEICTSLLDALNECVQIFGPILVLSYIVKITLVFSLYPSNSIDDLPGLTGFKGDELDGNGEVSSGTQLPAFSGAYTSAHGTTATTCTPPLSHRRLMLQSTADLPLNFGFTGKGNTAKPEGLHEIIRIDVMGRKLYEDWGITPALVWKLDNNAVLDPSTFQ